MRGNTPPCAGDVPRQAAAASARPGGVFRPNSSVATPPTRSRIRWAATVAIDVPRLVAVAVIHEGTVNHMRRVASDRRVAKTAGRITRPLGDAFPVHGAQPIADESLGTTRANFTTMVADRRFSPFFYGITRRDRSKLLSLPARPTAGQGCMFRPARNDCVPSPGPHDRPAERAEVGVDEGPRAAVRLASFRPTRLWTLASSAESPIEDELGIRLM